MSPPDFFRSRREQMIDLRPPQLVFATRLAWASTEGGVGGDIRPAGRPRLPVRLMVRLPSLRNSFKVSDEELVERGAENVLWQYFRGMECNESRLPCDATRIGSIRRLLGVDGIEQLLKATMDCVFDINGVKPVDLKRVIVDTALQSKAIGHPMDRRSLEIAQHKVVCAAKRAGIALKQTCAQDDKAQRRKAGGYAEPARTTVLRTVCTWRRVGPMAQRGLQGCAKQFKRLCKTVRRERTILGIVMRELQRKLDADQAVVAAGGALVHEASSPKALAELASLMERAERIRFRQSKSKLKLYALHATEVGRISKGKAWSPYEFGVKFSLAVTHKQGVMVGARSLPGNQNEGHVLSAQLEQTTNLLQGTFRAPKQVIVDLGYRGIDTDNPHVQNIHRGKYKSMSKHETRPLKHRQAIEPQIGRTKSDHRTKRCWLQGALGNALHALSCEAGNNIRWLLRAIAGLGLGGPSIALSAMVVYGLAILILIALHIGPRAAGTNRSPSRVARQGAARSSLALAG